MFYVHTIQFLLWTMILQLYQVQMSLVSSLKIWYYAMWRMFPVPAVRTGCLLYAILNGRSNFMKIRMMVKVTLVEVKHAKPLGYLKIPVLSLLLLVPECDHLLPLWTLVFFVWLLKVSGEANETQISEALKRYSERAFFVREALFHLFSLTHVMEKTKPEILKVEQSSNDKTALQTSLCECNLRLPNLWQNEMTCAYMIRITSHLCLEEAG